MAKKLLLADDSITIQKVVELVLSEEDFQIKAVNNGTEALNQVEVFKPDIVLADIEMPEINGYQLCERIKKSAGTAHIPVILLAGAFEPLDEELAKNVGADDFIIKPFESQELISKINAVITSAGIEAETMEAEAAVSDVPAGEEAVEELAVADTVEPAVAEEEDLWAMEDIETVEEDETEVWEIDEAETLAEAAAEAQVADMELPAADTATFEPVEEAPPVVDELPSDVAGGVIPEEAQPEPQPETAPVVEPEPVQPEPPEQVPVPEPEPEPEPVMTPPQPAVQPQPVPVQEAEPAAVAVPPVQMPSGSEIETIVRDTVQKEISGVLGALNLSGVLEGELSAGLKDSVEKLLLELVPGMLQESIKTMLEGALSSLNRQIENIIWETVPDLAENIIRKEIEKIKSEF